MRVEEIERLLAEFYEGNTSENQEEKLKKYFETQNVPEHLEKDKRLFLCFHKDVPVEVPAALEDKLSRMIDTKEQEEIHFFRKNKSKRNWRWVGGIAASIVLLFGLGYSISNISDTMEKPKETFTDPEVAYEVLQATLMEVSMGLNNGVDEMIDTQKDIRRTNREIKRIYNYNRTALMIMKTNRLFLAGVLLLLPLLCQAQGLFAKYSDMNNVSSVYISKAMIEMNPELYTKDVNVGKLAKQLELVQILSTMDNGIKREMRRDIESVVRAQKYELLMKQKGIVSRMAFYVKRKGETVQDLIMVVDGAATLKYVRLVGDMTIKDIQNIMKSQKTSDNTYFSIPTHEINNAFKEISIALGELKKIEGITELKDLKKEMKKLQKETEEMGLSYIIF